MTTLSVARFHCLAVGLLGFCFVWSVFSITPASLAAGSTWALTASRSRSRLDDNVYFVKLEASEALYYEHLLLSDLQISCKGLLNLPFVQARSQNPMPGCVFVSYLFSEQCLGTTKPITGTKGSGRTSLERQDVSHSQFKNPPTTPERRAC